MEISTIVSRLKKVDPTLTLKELRPSKRHQIDLEVILDDLDELSEYLAYQRDFEDDEDEDRVLLPLTLSGPMGPGAGGQPLEDPPPDEGMIPSDVVEPSPSIGTPSRNARIGSETSLDPPRGILPGVKSEPTPRLINDDEVEYEASVEVGRGQPPADADSEDEYTSPLNMSWRTDEDSQTDGSEPSPGEPSPARGQRPSLQLEGASRMTFASARAKIAQQLQPKRKRKK